MHILPAEEGLPDLPEEGSTVKKDPSEEGEGLAPASPTSATTANGNVNVNGSNGNCGEQTTIKANKGMILRKVYFCCTRDICMSNALDSRSSTFDTFNSWCRCRHRGEETWRSGIRYWRESWQC